MNFQQKKCELQGLYCTHRNYSLLTLNSSIETGKHSYLLDLQIVEGSKANGETSCFIRLTKYLNKNNNKKCPVHVSGMRGKKETGITILVGKSLCMWASNRTNEFLGRTHEAFFPSYFNLYNENSQTSSWWSIYLHDSKQNRMCLNTWKITSKVLNVDMFLIPNVSQAIHIEFSVCVYWALISH